MWAEAPSLGRFLFTGLKASAFTGALLRKAIPYLKNEIWGTPALGFVLI